MCEKSPIVDFEKACADLNFLDASLFQVFDRSQLTHASQVIVDIMSQVIDRRRLTLMTHQICSRPWLHDHLEGNATSSLMDIADLTDYHLRSFLGLLSIATLEGNDATAHFPNRFFTKTPDWA